MSGELTHPNIIDGWYHERSEEQWPGQAMTLQVKKVLHTEQSKFQDVLVFESATYGNVLVLDGAIQCTERDEFSYQEMIAHIPLASHPNPKNVLVIGGGDGGVLREILKHPSVEKAVLVDIDEAVPRVSKLYLKEMAKGFDDPRVTLHIGDGFKWLQENKGSYDVIITDSSDPVGPANSLFQQPYFQLLKDALAPGGTISTQGESMWCHLPLIASLQASTRGLFPNVEYAWTSIPTYPSGMIGFVVASLDEKRDLKTAVRSVSPTRYWSPTVHSAAFALPEFVGKAIKDGAAKSSSSSSKSSPKKILLLGSGFVAQPTADYILRRSENSLTVGCRTLSAAQAFVSTLSGPAEAVSVDVSDASSLDEQVKKHDLIISLIPYTHHKAVIESAIRFKKNVVTTSYVSPAMEALHEDAKKAGIIVMNEIGLDPGIDHLYAVKMIDEIHKEGGKVDSFLSYCGGLPAPSAADNPLGYKFSWSSRGVLLALLNTGKFYRDGETKEVAGKDLMSEANPYYISPAFAFVAYPNRDSTPFREKYQIPEVKTLVRGTLRYQGFPEFVKALVNLGFLNEEEKPYLVKGTKGLSWNEVTAKAIGAKDSSEESLVAKVVELAQFPNKSEQQRIISGLRWIGLFDKTPVEPRGNLLDSLCATLEKKMQYEKGEKDMVMLQHKFEVTKKDGSREVRTATLLDMGAPYHTNSGPSSMAKLVGVPCGIAVQLILDGVITTPGVLAPYSVNLVDPILKELNKEGIEMVEKSEAI